MKPYLKKLSSELFRAWDITNPRKRSFHKIFYSKTETFFTNSLPPNIKNALVKLLSNMDEEKTSDISNKISIENYANIFKYKTKILKSYCYSCLLSATLESLSRGIAFYMPKLDYILLKKLLYLNGFSPMEIPLTENNRLDIDFFDRNAVEYSVFYLSIPNLLSGYIYDEEMYRILETAHKIDEGMIIDGRNIFHLFELSSDLKPTYNPSKLINIINSLLDDIQLRFMENICIIIRIPIGFYVPLIRDLIMVTGGEEWIGNIEKIYRVKYEEEDYFMEDIWNKALSNFDKTLNLIHFINKQFLKYIKIAFEELKDYIIIPENYLFGGYNILVDLEGKKSWDTAMEISTATGQSTYPSLIKGRSNVISLHLLPKRDMNLDEYQEMMGKIRKIISKKNN